MAGRQIYNPDGFKNIEEGGKVIGYQFDFKAQYYRCLLYTSISEHMHWILHYGV